MVDVAAGSVSAAQEGEEEGDREQRGRQQHTPIIQVDSGKESYIFPTLPVSTATAIDIIDILAFCSMSDLTHLTLLHWRAAG